MDIYLEQRKKDISAFKKAIKLCKEDLKTAAILKKYLKRIEEEYRYADYLEASFIPLIQSKENFCRAFMFYTDNGDYNIEVYLNNADEISKSEYMDIYKKFQDDNEESFFHFEVYDIIKDKNIYDEAIDFDKITIKPKKR